MTRKHDKNTEDILKDIPIIKINAQMALMGKLKNKEKLVEMSGYFEFEKQLDKFIEGISQTDYDSSKGAVSLLTGIKRGLEEELGIPEVWVEVVQKAGVVMVADLKELNPNKFHQDICGINKKNKLGLTNPSKEEVAAWIEQVSR